MTSGNSQAPSARQSATPAANSQPQDLSALLGEQPTRASTATVSSVNMEEIDKLLSGAQGSSAGSQVTMAEIDALLAEQAAAPTPVERERVSKLLSLRLSMLQRQQATGQPGAAPPATGTGGLQPSMSTGTPITAAGSRPRQSSSASAVSMDEIDKLLENSSTAGLRASRMHHQQSPAATAPAAGVARSRPTSNVSSLAGMEEIDALLAETSQPPEKANPPLLSAPPVPAAAPLAAKQQQPPQPRVSALQASNDGRRSQHLVTMDEIDALLSDAPQPAAAASKPASRPVSNALSFSEIDRLLASDSPQLAASMMQAVMDAPQQKPAAAIRNMPPSASVPASGSSSRQPSMSLDDIDALLTVSDNTRATPAVRAEGQRAAGSQSQNQFIDAFGIAGVQDQAADRRPLSAVVTPSDLSELDAILGGGSDPAAAQTRAELGGSFFVLPPAGGAAASATTSTPTGPDNTRQFRRPGYEEVRREELDDLLGPDRKPVPKTLYDVEDNPAARAAELHASRQQSLKEAASNLKTPEEREAAFEAERLAREDAEKAKHETAEETLLRRKFEEMKRRDDLLVAKAQAAEREERRRRQELAAKIDAERAKNRENMSSAGTSATETSSQAGTRSTALLLEPKLYSNSQADLEAKQRRQEEEERKRRALEEQRYKEHTERRRLQQAEQILAEEAGLSTLQYAGQQQSYFRWNIVMKELLIKERLGAGEFGDAYRGFYKEQQITVKKLKAPALTEEYLNKVRNEVKALAILSHPTLVRFLGISSGESELYSVCEFITGMPLFGLLRNKGLSDSVDNATILTYARSIADGLAYLHANKVVHRSLKTRNILVDRQGLIKIRDYGLLTVKEHVEANEALVAPEYCSPELLARRTVDDRTDVYSFGMVLLEMFAKDSVYPREMDVTAIANGVLTEGLRPQMPINTPYVFIKLIESCWQTDPNLRPAFEKIKKILAQPKEKIFAYQPKQ